jgi:hypothetical protein
MSAVVSKNEMAWHNIQKINNYSYESLYESHLFLAVGAVVHGGGGYSHFLGLLLPYLYLWDNRQPQKTAFYFSKTACCAVVNRWSTVANRSLFSRFWPQTTIFSSKAHVCVSEAASKPGCASNYQSCNQAHRLLSLRAIPFKPSFKERQHHEYGF